DSGSSQESVNKDWENWVVMHGTEKVAVEDVWGIGKAIGVKFNGDDANLFRVLSRKGRGRQPKVGVEGE
ncbi:sulfate transporter, partial [Trifolium medium]|nr:sulfate transporter [Trifolium medium]